MPNPPITPKITLNSNDRIITSTLILNSLFDSSQYKYQIEACKGLSLEFWVGGGMHYQPPTQKGAYPPSLLTLRIPYIKERARILHFLLEVNLYSHSFVTFFIHPLDCHQLLQCGQLRVHLYTYYLVTCLAYLHPH